MVGVPTLNDLIYQFYGGTPSLNDAQYAALLAAYNAGINAGVLIGSFADLQDAEDGSVITVEGGVIQIGAGGGGGGSSKWPTYYSEFDPTAGGVEIEVLNTNDVSGGTYTLGQDGTDIGPIDWDADQATTQTAFDDALGAGVVTISNKDLLNYRIDWTDSGPQEPLEIVSDDLTGGDVGLVVFVQQQGANPVASPAIGASWYNPQGQLATWQTIGNTSPAWNFIQLNSSVLAGVRYSNDAPADGDVYAWDDGEQEMVPGPPA